MKKGQITLFIIIGIIILITFVMLYYLLRGNQETTMRNTVETVATIFAEHGKYHEYVITCMEQGTKRGLFLIGMQGGAIYDYEATGTKRYRGPSTGFPYGKHVLAYRASDGVIYNVSYGLVQPQYGSLFHPEVPFYPYGLTKLISNPRIISPSYVNVFGNYPQSPLTPLCDYHGGNRRNLSETVACESYDSISSDDRNSIQQYLERYIENYTMECIRLETLPELAKSNVTKGDIRASVTFGEDHLFVNITLPIKIQVGSRKSYIQLSDFQLRYRVRLKKIHELVSHLLDRDANNIFFNIVRDAGTLNDCRDITGGNARCLKDGMQVVKFSNVCLSLGICATDGAYDDILMVIDRDAMLDGKPYVFIVAMENRPPALDLIRTAVGTGSFNYDYILSQGQKITIEPRGIDPDEDQHNSLGFMDNLYHYYGWKETYDEFYDQNLKAGCKLNNPECQQRTDVPLHLWTQSSSFSNSKGRNADYTTNKSDIGFHTLKVEVCDEGNACDYQLVNIYVANDSFVGGYSLYEDIQNGYASKEDFYIVSSPLTSAYSFSNPPRHEWSAYSEIDPTTPLWTKTTVEHNFSLPTPPYDINTITSDIAPFFPTIQTYTIKVEIYDGSDLKSKSDPDSNLEVQVKQCLPHRSAIAPYPYNPTGTDPFFANHSCCIGNPWQPNETGWGTFASDTQTCYSSVEWGCLEDTNYRSYYAAGEITYQTIYTGASDGDSTNDIYQRTFQRNCDGTRGNVCIGPKSDTRERVASCSECETCGYSDVSQPSCQEVPASAGKICNSGVWRCTKGEAEAYFGAATYGPWWCQGACTLGQCNTSVNCRCEKACGAVCNTTDKRSYQWNENQCAYSCNNFLNTPLATDCDYHALDTNMRCHAPDPNSPSCFSYTYNDTVYTVCPEDTAYTGTLDSLDPYPVTYCRRNDQCYYAVFCDGNGPNEAEGEACLDAGLVDDLAGTEYDGCFYNPAGTVSCAYDGVCEFRQNWSIDCDAGMVIDGVCVDEGTCHFNIACDPSAGWQSSASDLISLSGIGTKDCNDIDCSDGFYWEDPYCYYGISCGNAGWMNSGYEDCSARASGNRCFYNADCTMSGCEYDEDASPPTCNIGKVLTCTNNGWRCV
jgi:hypothetical protein